MMRLQKLTLILLLICGCTNYSLADELEDLIRSEFLKIAPLAETPNLTLELSKAQNASSKAVKGGKIIVNVAQVKNLIDKVEPGNKINVVRMVICHELAHQMQFFFRVVSSSTLLNEAQADVIGGFLMFKILISEGMQNGTIATGDFTEIKRSAEDAMNAVSVLGDEYNTTHPGREQRLMALKYGINYGALWFSDQCIRNPNIPESSKAPAKAFYKKYSKLLNYLTDDFLQSWTAREANKIIHNLPENARSLAVYNDWKWNTSIDSPYLNYTQTIRNFGAKRVRISYYNQLFYASRKEPENPLFWEIQENQPEMMVLNPGDIKTISNRMKWDGDVDKMPKFVAPGFKGSFYTVTSIQGATTSAEITDALSLSNIEEDITDVNALDVIFNQQKDLSPFISGIANCWGKECEYMDYQSKVKVGAADTRLVYNRKEDSLHMEILLYDGADKQESERKKAAIMTRLQEVLPASAFGDERTIMGHRYRIIYDAARVEIGDIYIEDSTNHYRVGMNVYSSKGLGYSK